MASIILPEGTANFAFLTKPRKNKKRPDAEPAFSVLMSFDKDTIDTDDSFKELRRAVLALAKEKVGDNAKKLIERGKIGTPIRDGSDMTDKDGNELEEFADCYVMTLRRRADLGAPGLVDAQVRPITDPTEVYSGMRCICSVNPYWYDQDGNRGVALGLNNVQKTADGTRKGGKPDPKSEFSSLKKAKSKRKEDEDDDDDIPF